MRHEALSVAVDAVRNAARLCKAVRAQPDFESIIKQDRSPVTVADFGSQALVCKALAEAFPQIPIVAEEGAAELRTDPKAFGQVVDLVKSQHPQANSDDVCDWIDLGAADPPSSGPFWTLDPIDGTKGFLRNQHYAVALALIDQGQLLLAVMACPVLNSLFVAVQGQGAGVLPLDGSGIEPIQPIRVNVVEDFAQVRLCESVESAHANFELIGQICQTLGIVLPPIKMDSQVKYGVLAQGQAELYLRITPDPNYREKIWDHAAGALIIQEAGGTVSDLAGNPLDFRQGRALAQNTGVLVAASSRLHQAALDVIRGS